MNKKELEQMEKLWVKYHKSIPDYPILECKRRNIDTALTYIMVFLMGILFVLMVLIVYLIKQGCNHGRLSVYERKRPSQN
jgi:hypothetical protein